MKTFWITDDLPFSFEPVLIRRADETYPVWPGFYDADDGWRNADGSPVKVPVLGWMDLVAAAVILDSAFMRESLQKEEGP